MRKYLILAGCLFIAAVAQAQNPNTDNGYIPGHSYQSNDIDVVDVGGGNMTLKIPIRSYKQEGSESIDYYLYFPGKHFESMTGDGETGPTGLWTWIDPREPSPWTDPYGSTYYGGVYLMTNQDWHAGYPTTYGQVEMSPDGARHLFINTNNPTGPGYAPWPSADASGYAMTYNGILDPNGVVHGGGGYIDRNYPALQPSSPDVNGASFLTDLSGRTLPYTDNAGPPGDPAANTSACPTAATEAFNVNFPGAVSNPSAGGNYDTYVFCYAPVTINTSFNQGGVTELLDKTMQFLQAVVLPNGQSWQFQYDAYGDLTKVTYPTGAYTNYSYTTMTPECLIGDDTTPSSRYLTQKIENSLDAPPATWKYSIGHPGGYASSFAITPPPDAAVGVSGLTLYGQIITPENITQTYLFAEQGSENCPSFEQGFLDGKGSGRITVNTITGYTALDPNGPLPISGYTYSPRFVATWGPTQSPVATSKFYDEEYTQVISTDPTPDQRPQYVYLSHGDVIAEFTYPYTGPLDFSQLGAATDVALGVTNNNGEDATGKLLDTYMASPTGYPFPAIYPTGSLPSGVSKYVETRYEYQPDYGSPPNTAVAYDNLVSLVSSRTIYDSSRNIVAQTVNTYDDHDVGGATTMISMPTIPGGWWPGFMASTSTWLSGTNWTTQTFTPDSHAEVAAVTDANGHTTSYGRDSNDINITSVTQPSTGGVSHVTQSTYDPGTGQIASQIDENGKTTSYTYGPMARLVKVQPPATAAGQPEVDLCYTDLQSCPVVGTAALTIVSQTKQSSSGTPVTISQTYDDFGRPVESALYDTTGPIKTDTVYDSLGRKTSVSNPYRTLTDSTYGLTQYNYPVHADSYPVPTPVEVDTTTPDGTVSTDISVLSTDTPALSVETITGPNAKVRTTDIFGNLTSVVAPIGSGTYAYDLNKNLTYANGRIFTYDGASRLLTSTNPETGTISYSYDGVGNLVSKTDARGITTAMAYDALNRVVSKTYSGPGSATTPSTCYLYDNATSGANGIGRLVQEWTQAGTCSPTAQLLTVHDIYAYDPAGHITSDMHCIGNTKCFTTSNTYDLAGNLSTYLTQSNSLAAVSWGLIPPTITNAYDSANRLQMVSGQNGPFGVLPTLSWVNGFGPAGPISVGLNGSTMTTSYTYDKMMRPKSATTTLP